MILHITHTLGGGTQKYIDDIIHLFPNEQHKIINKAPFEITNIDKLKLVHIHATMFGYHIGWHVLTLIEHLKRNNIPVYLTIHDYQWLFTENPAPTTEEFNTLVPKEEDVNKCTKLLQLVDKIICPSESVYMNYKRVLGDVPDNKTFVISHCDIELCHEQLRVPKIHTNINIAFIGLPSIYKGIRQFFQLSKVMPKYYDKEITYHLYGGSNIMEASNVIEHGSYNNDTLIEQLHNDNIHIVLSISIAEETYCYSLSQLINSGIPLVYFNRGALKTRLPKKDKYFPVNGISILDLQNQIVNAIRYCMTEPHMNYKTIGNDVKLNDFYRDNYISS
jgi:glycosyltransferase involved in cell wall biosynthesis